MSAARDVIAPLLAGINAFDDHEASDLAFAKRWLDATSDVYRRQKPGLPSPHLVAYFLPVCASTDRALLVDHLDARAWLPPGGHVEVNEHPSRTVERECAEELGVAPRTVAGPCFLTVRTVKNPKSSHIDVSLWYTVELPAGWALKCEPSEHAGARWWLLADILSAPAGTVEPNLSRFLRKWRDGGTSTAENG
ncbi:MAG TPA: NUDIX hydrolase [Acidimicrobiales bacterium]|nr:NUDIX hydrolase [Acidimicrobiales bacterium]